MDYELTSSEKKPEAQTLYPTRSDVVPHLNSTQRGLSQLLYDGVRNHTAKTTQSVQTTIQRIKQFTWGPFLIHLQGIRQKGPCVRPCAFLRAPGRNNQKLINRSIFMTRPLQRLSLFIGFSKGSRLPNPCVIVLRSAPHELVEEHAGMNRQRTIDILHGR